MLAGLVRAWGKEKAVDYFKKLAAQEPVVKGEIPTVSSSRWLGNTPHHRLRAHHPKRNIVRTSYRLGSARTCTGSGQSADACGQSPPSKRWEAVYRLSAIQGRSEDAGDFRRIPVQGRYRAQTHRASSKATSGLSNIRRIIKISMRR